MEPKKASFLVFFKYLRKIWADVFLNHHKYFRVFILKISESSEIETTEISEVKWNSLKFTSEVFLKLRPSNDTQ